MRVKRMPEEEFREVLKRNWAPVQLTGGAIPVFLRNIPSHLVHSVYGSASSFSKGPYSSAQIPSGELMGGIDVYRYAPDDPVELNKDWYPIIKIPGDDTIFLIDGPIKDSEHWLDEIPQRLAGVEILAVPPKLEYEEVEMRSSD